MTWRYLRFFIFILLPFQLFAQNWEFNNSWVNIGPNDVPFAKDYKYAAGTGPVECIRIAPSNPQYMLMSSLNGGIFYSENGGEQWLNAGTDYWTYSASPWCDFYPENENIWFGVMHQKGKNGKAGDIGKYGGVLRTKDKGLTWEKILNVSHVGGEYVEIYSTKFHPDNPKMMFVLTSSGLFYTNDCLASMPEWSKFPNVDGWIYDMEFVNDKIYLSNFQFGKWNLFEVNQFKFSEYKKSEGFLKYADDTRNLTIEPYHDSLLVLVDHSKGSDQLLRFYPKKDDFKLLSSSERVNFGSGHTFAVNPFNTNQIFIGNSTKIKYFNYDTKKSANLGSDYHVDVEYVIFHPNDSAVVYIATHGGVWKSTDGGKNWEAKTKGLGIAEVTGISVDPNNPARVMASFYHDGSAYLSSDRTDIPSWEIINGGDGLQPLIHPNKYNVTYSSNQFTGGGVYISNDTVYNYTNIHSYNHLKTSGWEMAYVLHPEIDSLLLFNFMHSKGEKNGSIDIARTFQPDKRDKAEIISDFMKFQGMQAYKVYGIFNSEYYPNRLFAYVLDFVKDENNKPITNHRLFYNNNVLDSAEVVQANWVEVEMPFNSWLGGIAFHPKFENRIYLAYAGGKSDPESMFGDKGMAYAIKFKEKSDETKVKREIDISRNVPNGIGGKYNICELGGTGWFALATQTGVYLGDNRSMKGKGRWVKLGVGLPNCKPYGIDFNKKKEIITVGLFGRGVWQYQL